VYKNLQVAAVVPCYNEGHFVGRVIATMPDLVDMILVIDDCSEDGTSHAALAASDRRVQVFRTPRNLGVGGAVTLGYRKALELKADLVVKMDGDGQMPPEYLPALLDPVVEEGYDYAKGNRFLVESSVATMPRRRLFGNIVHTFLTKVATGFWHIFDPANGYTAIRADALRAIDLDSLHRGYFFEPDMLFQVSLHGFLAADVAIPARYGEEESGVSLWRAALTFPFLLAHRFLRRVYWKYIVRDFSPIALFLMLGSILVLWGGGFGAYLWIRSSVTGQPSLTGSVMLAMLPLILGFQLLLQAMVLDIQETPKKPPEDRVRLQKRQKGS
jgi:glycosyltransferase involved in cell wall biosynthesis